MMRVAHLLALLNRPFTIEPQFRFLLGLMGRNDQCVQIIHLRFPGQPVLDMLASSYSINPTRIIISSALPEGRFDFAIKTKDMGTEEMHALLKRAVETTFGLIAKQESREMDVFVLKSGLPTEHLAPTASTGGLL
jgi:hypothetical protein